MAEDRVDDASSPILRAICEYAQAYSVFDSEIRQVYELWPFNRVDDFEQLIAKCPKYDRFKDIDKSLGDLHNQIDDLRGQLELQERQEIGSEKIRQIVEKQVKAVIEDITASANESLNKLQKEILNQVQTIAEEASRLSAQQQNLVSRSDVEKLIAFHREQVDKAVAQTLENFQSDMLASTRELSQSVARLEESHKLTFDVSNDVVARLQSQIDDLVTSLDQFVAESITDGKPSSSSSNRSIFQRIRPARSRSEFFELDESEFIRRFTAFAKTKRIDEPQGLLRLTHSLLTELHVCVVADTGIVDAWLEALGWNADTLRVAASPTWSSVNDLRDGFDFLIEKTSSPRLLFIYDFDVGLVQGYLDPFLRVWGQQDSDGGKIILVSSIGERVFGKMKSPAFWFEKMDQESIDYLCFPDVSEEKAVVSASTPVMRSCVASWRNAPDDKMVESRYDFDREIFSVLSALSVAPNTTLQAFVSKIFYALNPYCPNLERLTNVVLRCVVHPWVECNYGEQPANELHAYIETRK